MVIKILGLSELIKEFGDIGNIDLMPEIKEATRRVQRSAKDLAPVDTGTLRASIKVKFLNKKHLTGIVFTPVEYAIDQEFGTSKMKAQPFMIPALNMNRAAINSSMRKYINNQLRNPGKKSAGFDSGDTDTTQVASSRPKVQRRTRVNGGFIVSAGGKVVKGTAQQMAFKKAINRLNKKVKTKKSK